MQQMQALRLPAAVPPALGSTAVSSSTGSTSELSQNWSAMTRVQQSFARMGLEQLHHCCVVWCCRGASSMPLVTAS
jgi:hypothetical protein